MKPFQEFAKTLPENKHSVDGESGVLKEISISESEYNSIVKQTGTEIKEAIMDYLLRAKLFYTDGNSTFPTEKLYHLFKKEIESELNKLKG